MSVSSEEKHTEIEAGSYQGTWGGYVVSFNGYEVRLNEGIRCPSCPCNIDVSEDGDVKVNLIKKHVKTFKERLDEAEANMTEEDINFDEVTAANMRESADKNGDGLKEILTQIYKANKAEKKELYLSDYSMPGHLRYELERRGFNVDKGGRYNEINTVITW